MAGIGFELQRSLDRKTYTSYLQAYLTAMAYSSGPWISTLVSLLLISSAARASIGVKAVNQFTSILVYIYALSLVVTGPIQLVLTRYVADRLYEEDRDGVLAGVLHALALAGGLSGLAWYAFSASTGLPPDLLVAATFLQVVIACVWIIMAYVTSLKRYRQVTGLFAGGCLLAVFLAVGLAREGGMGTTGLLLGFALGHAAILAGLASVSTQEYVYERRPVGDFLGYFVRMPGLALVGLLMNCGMWVDKFLVWGMTGTQELPGFYSNWIYDIPAYLAYLSVLPSQAFFLIKVETRFDERYQRFLRAVLDSPAEVVVKRKDEMTESLRDGLSQLFKFQGVISLVLLLLAPKILVALRLHTLNLVLVEGMMLGAYCHFGLLHTLVFMMYLDQRSEMVRILVLFVSLTLGGTYLALQYGPNSSYWCLGYIVASLVCMLVAIRRTLRLADRIDYLLLFRQELRDAEQRLIVFRPAADAMSGR